MVEATGELNSHSILKVPIAKVGSWAHPTYGTVAFSPEDFDAAITNFNVGALGFEPHLSFGHLDEEPNSTDSARKRGNLKYLMKDGDSLDGYFSVPRGVAEAVAEGEYEYSSGEFIRNLMDKNSGEYRGMAISRVALTNTPYLPWGESGKVQLLSHTGNMPKDIFTSAVKLSTTAESPVDIVQGNNSMTAQTIEQAPTVPAVTVPSDLTPAVTTPTVAVTNPGLDIEAITAAILAQVKAEQDRTRAEQDASLKAEQERIKAEKDAAIAASNATVANLEAKMLELTERLAKAETEASAFTNHASRAAQEAEAAQLMSMGASALIVNRYSAIRQALEAKSSTVKLSQGGVEKESSLMESIRDLLVGSLQQTPVVTTQMGLAGVSSQEEGGVKGFLEKVISENRQKATKVAI